MNNGFPTKPLQSLCNNFKQDIVDGPFGSELKREDYITEGTPVLKIQNVKPFAIELKKMSYISAEKFHELRRHSFRRGDIVMTKLGSPLGVSAIVEDVEEGVIVADLVRIRAQQINTKYLCYHLNSQRTNDFINSMQKGMTRPRVTLSVVRELPIYAPPLGEQKRIVAKLDVAFAGLAKAKQNAEKNLQNARALFESGLQNAIRNNLGDKTTKRLGQVCVVERGSSPRPIKQFFTTRASGVNWIKIGDTQEGEKYIYKTGQKITPEGAKQSRFVDVGDLVLTNSMSFGRPYIMKTSGYIHDGWFVLRPDKCIEADFFYYLLSSRHVQEQFHKLAAGSVVKNISGDLVKQALLPVPSLEEQRQIAFSMSKLAQETQYLTRHYEQKIVALDALKKSILHEAFSGNL
jgi:type I restriction enzyme S subunit